MSYMTVTLIHATSVTQDLLDWAREKNHAGNPVRIITLGEFVYTTTISTEDVKQYATDNSLTLLEPTQGDDESLEDFIDRLRPIMLGAFGEMRAGNLFAMHMPMWMFRLMQAQLEWPKE